MPPCAPRKEAPGSDHQEEDPDPSPDSSSHGIGHRNSGSNSSKLFEQYPDTPLRHGGHGDSTLEKGGKDSSPGQNTRGQLTEIFGSPENQGQPGGDDESFRTSPEESERTTEAHLQERGGRIHEMMESLGVKESVISSDPQEAQRQKLKYSVHEQQTLQKTLKSGRS